MRKKNLTMTRSTKILLFTYLFSKVKTVGGDVFLIIKKTYRSHNNARFCIFEHFTNSGLCHVFGTNSAFVTFLDFENNQEYKPKYNFIIISRFLVIWKYFHLLEFLEKSRIFMKNGQIIRQLINYYSTIFYQQFKFYLDPL